MTKVMYRPLGLLFSIFGGLAASAVFKAIWTRLAHEEDAPSADQAHRGWREIIPAAAVQGAVFGAVKAGVDRGGLKSFEKMTGVWAGES